MLERLMMNRVLVTGGRGYVGSNLVDYLRREKGVNCTILDIENGGILYEDIKPWKYDGMVHLAAIAGISECKESPESAIENNVTSTLYIMQQAHKYDVPLVFASSGAAPTPYESLYAMTKYIGECEAKRLIKTGGRIHILRFSNIYGGEYWEHKPSVIPLFLKAKARGEKLIVNGDGSQKRDFIHVKDVCRAIWLALNKNRIIGEPIEICSGKLTSVLEIAKLIGGEDGYEFNSNSDMVGVSEVNVDTHMAKATYEFEAQESMENTLSN